MSGTGATVEEGETAKVCSCIISPKQVDRTIIVSATTVPATATGGWFYTAVLET